MTNIVFCSLRASPPGRPIAALIAFWGPAVKMGSHRRAPKKRRLVFEPNRNAGNPVSAPSRRARIGHVGASRFAMGRAEGFPPRCWSILPLLPIVQKSKPTMYDAWEEVALAVTIDVVEEDPQLAEYEAWEEAALAAIVHAFVADERR